MKTIWTVEIRMMNGTVTMGTRTHSFLDKELAEKTAEAVRIKNKGAEFGVIVIVSKSELYENEAEVPILNQQKYKNGQTNSIY